MMRIRSMKSKNRGFSLLELMVGIALGTFILLGLVSAMEGLLRGDSISAARLGNEVRNAAFFVERDVTRAGYQAGAAAALAAGTAAHTNPFALLDVSTPGCIRYSYDRNSNGLLDIASPDERYALVLSGGVLFVRVSGNAFNCDVSQGIWEPLTALAAVTVTEFTPSVAASAVSIPNSTRKIQVRTLTYTLKGALTRNPVKTLSVANTLALPNDVLIEGT